MQKQNNNFDNDDIPSNELQFSNDDDILDTLLIEIRGKAISNATYKKIKNKEEELLQN